MIRGYYLKYAPYMDKYTKEDIIGELDLLKEDTKGKGKVHGKETSRRSSYFGRRFYTTLFQFDNEESKIALYEIYKTLEDALPRYVKVFELKSGTIVTSVPYFNDKVEDYIYNLAMDELLRITGFIYMNMSSSSVLDFLRDYEQINIYIEEDHNDKTRKD